MQVAFETGFISGQLFIQPRIFQRDRQVGGEDRKRLYVILGKIIELRTLQIQHPDHNAFVNHRNRQFRTRFGIDHQVAGIG